MIFRDVDMALDAGEILLVTGENGSGKSTLLRTLAGLLPPSSGTVLWREKNIGEEPESYRHDIRYLGHLDAVKPEFTVVEMLNYWRALLGLAQTTVLLPNDPFDVLANSHKLIRHLSAGQKRRLALSRLLLNEAPLWIMDEPTTALDAKGQDILVKTISRFSARGGIAIIATHQELPFKDAAHYVMKGRLA